MKILTYLALVGMASVTLGVSGCWCEKAPPPAPPPAPTGKEAVSK